MKRANETKPVAVPLSELPEVTEIDDLFLFGSKTNDAGVPESCKMPVDRFLEHAKEIQRIRVLAYRMETKQTDIFIGESMTMYYIKGENVGSLKINNEDVALNEYVTIYIPVDSIVSIEITPKLTDAVSYLYILSTVDSDTPIPDPAYGNHILNTNNPHKVTKSQVGLGNLPNAKTDDANVNDSNILATTAMVHNVVGGSPDLSLSFAFPATVESILYPITTEILDLKEYILNLRLWEIQETSSAIQTFIPADSLIVQTYLQTRQQPEGETQAGTFLYIKANNLNGSSKYQVQFLLLKVKKNN